MNDIEVGLQDTQDISTQVYDINYIPDYVKAEQERRENEVIRQANELLRIALYEDLEYKKDTDYWRGTGIASIEKTDTEGLVDTYTITYENGYTSTFTVTNGKYDRIAGANATIDDNIGTPSVTVNTTSILAPDGTGYIKNFSFNFSNLKGEKGEQGERGEAGSIKFLIVAELPQTGADDTIYLVPITPDEGDNNYAEYIYVNGEWELLGRIGVHVDLTDYVKNTNYANSSTGGVIKVQDTLGLGIGSTGNLFATTKTYATYQTLSEGAIVGKGTLENVITGKQLINQTTLDNSQATQDTKITNLENQVFGDETIEAENTSMTLNGTLKGQFNSIDLKGNTSQTGTPTPSSPIPVNVVSGDNEINVCGKNLLPFKDINITKSTLNIYSTNGNLYINGTNTTPIYSSENLFEFTLNKGTYTSTPITSGIPSYYLKKKSDGTLINQTNRTFTLNETTIVYLCAFIGANTYSNYQVSWQLEKGTSATNYEPYQGNTYNIDLPEGMELYSSPDGTKRDGFIHDKTTDKWYLHKEIWKAVFIGASGENWSFQSGSVWKYRIGINNSLLSTSDTQPPMVLSNYYKAGIWNSSNNYEMGSLPSISTTLAIRNDDISTLEAFKTWLSTHNLSVYYQLATPTNTEITDTTLISQLNALEQAQSKENQTNISQVNNDLPFIISTSAFLNNINGKIGLLNKLTEV